MLGSTAANAVCFPSVELFVKGKDAVMVKDGKIQHDAMKSDFITLIGLLWQWGCIPTKAAAK